MGASSDTTIGYRYYMSLHMGICRGSIDELIAIEVGGRGAWFRDTIFPPEIPESGVMQFQINVPDLFGGDSGEGGIYGTAWLMLGRPTQVMPERVRAVTWPQEPIVGPQLDQPEFRGVTSIFYDGLISSLNPYPKPWKFRVKRVLSGWAVGGPWYAEKAAITFPLGPFIQPIGAMNPAHIIYQTLTDKSWGRGVNAARLDSASFRKCADTLFDEGFGMCIRWNRSTTIQEFIQTVLDHIGGILRQDKVTGLYKMILIRKDYDINDLPTYTPKDSVIEVREASSGAVYGTVNEVIVRYHDPVTNKQAQVKANNIAAIQVAGSAVTTTRSYPGIPTAELALRVAQRDLKTMSTGLRRLTLVFSRSMWKLQPGDVFIFADDSRFIGPTVMRVATSEEADNTDGRIVVTAVQDVFSLSQTSFAGSQPPPPPPVQGPPPLPADFPAPPEPAPPLDPAIKGYMGYEQTYIEIARRLSPGDFAVWPATSGMVIYHMAKPEPTAQNVRIDVVSDSPATSNAGSGNFTPYVVISETLGHLTEDNIPYFASQDTGLVLTGQLALIGDEMVQLTEIDPLLKRISITRGVADTIPAEHPAGTPVWFIQGVGATDLRSRSPGVPVTIAGRPKNSYGPIDLVDAGYVTVDLDQRFNRPYPPGNVSHRLGAGLSAPWYEPVFMEMATGDLLLSWSHRDRLLQSDQLIGHSEGNIGPEPGSTYTVEVLDAVGTLKAEYAGISSTSFTYMQSQAVTDIGGPAEGLYQGTLKLFTVRDGLKSLYWYEIPVTVEVIYGLSSSDDKILASSDDYILKGADND